MKTDSLIEHPGRYFKNNLVFLAFPPTRKHDRAAPISLSLDRYLTFVERMPRIKHPRRPGFMGLVSLGCTTDLPPYFAHN